MAAGRPVASSIRFAARPVGAARRQRSPLARARARTALRVCVFPVPGPPVSRETGAVRAIRAAASCSGARRRPWRSASQPKATGQSTGPKMRPAPGGAPAGGGQGAQPGGQAGLGPGEGGEGDQPVAGAEGARSAGARRRARAAAGPP